MDTYQTRRTISKYTDTLIGNKPRAILTQHIKTDDHYECMAHICVTHQGEMTVTIIEIFGIEN